jgi:hypothetical protein
MQKQKFRISNSSLRRILCLAILGGQKNNNDENGYDRPHEEYADENVVVAQSRLPANDKSYAKNRENYENNDGDEYGQHDFELAFLTNSKLPNFT